MVIRFLNKGWLILAVLVISIFFSGCSGAPKIQLSTTHFDLGDINPDEGIRTETFFIKNAGKDILKINSVSTSCGCTEAEAEKKEILPGETIELVVIYDPSVHPGLTGEIKRIVYVKSNDPLNEEVELELTGNVLPIEE